jgi:hypothetical protein
MYNVALNVNITKEKQLRAYTMQGVANPQYKLYGIIFSPLKIATEL